MSSTSPTPPDADASSETAAASSSVIDRLRALLPWREHGKRALRVVEVGLWLLAAWWALAFFVDYLGIAGHTVGYPFHLEWMEGGAVETAARIGNGEPMYTEPSVDYVPYIYAPFYFLVTAVVGAVTGGVDLFAARLVSLLSILGCAAVCYRWIWRETANDLYRTRFGINLWGLLGVGLLFSTWEASGRWFHLARVDSLGLLLLFWGVYVLRFHRHWRGAVIGALLLWLAAITKQSSLIPIAAVLAVNFLTDWRNGLIAGALCTTLTLGTAAWLQISSDGWFLYYIWEVGRQHPQVDELMRGYWAGDMARMGVPLALAFIGVGLVAARNARDGLLDFALLAGVLVMSWLSRLHSGGYLNVLMPAFAGLMLFMPIGLARVAERVREADRERLGGSPLAMVLAGLVMYQCAIMHFDPKFSLPAPGSRESGALFLAEIAAIEGEVLLPDHRWVQTAAGKTSYGLGMAARDLLRMEDPDDPGRLALVESLERAFAEQRFSAVILSEPHPWHGMHGHYRFEREIHSAPVPVTGWRIKPVFLWVPVERRR